MQTVIRILSDCAMLPIILLAGFALLFRIPKEQRFAAYSRIIMAGLTAFLVAKLLGAVYQPATERPFELMGMAAGASFLYNPGFPSDHAVFATFFTLAVWYEARTRRIAVTMLILTLLVCVGRVLALVHTPLDVAGGILVAAVGALWYAQSLRQQRLAKTTKI